MTCRRVVVSGVCAAIAAFVLSACGASPLPPPLTVSSPYSGASTVVHDPISGFGLQVASVRVCSLTGGPLAVDVHSPGTDATTRLMVIAVSTDREATSDVAAASLIDGLFDRPTATVDTHVESTRPLRPGECADVSVRTDRNYFEAGPSFTFTVTW